MAKSNRRAQRFTLTQWLIAFSILLIVATVSIPAYKSYLQLADYREIVQAATPYKAGVAECYQNRGAFTHCMGGLNQVPANLTAPTGAVASLTVVAGVITVTPVAQKGILTTDTYVLTPTAINGVVTWTPSGDGITKGYTK
jgi:type IV pilus assembly protein PilA